MMEGKSMHEASKEKGKMELNGVSLLSVSYSVSGDLRHCVCVSACVLCKHMLYTVGLCRFGGTATIVECNVCVMHYVRDKCRRGVWI